MKNIQIIDEMPNTAYDIFSCSEADFHALFAPGTDIEFIEDVLERLGTDRLSEILTRLWKQPVVKSSVQGIHGTLFYGLAAQKRQFYPNKRESDLNQKGRGWSHD